MSSWGMEFQSVGDREERASWSLDIVRVDVSVLRLRKAVEEGSLIRSST